MLSVLKQKRKQTLNVFFSNIQLGIRESVEDII